MTGIMTIYYRSLTCVEVFLRLSREKSNEVCVLSKNLYQSVRYAQKSHA